MKTTIRSFILMLPCICACANDESTLITLPDVPNGMLHYRSKIRFEFTEDFLKSHDELKDDKEVLNMDVEYWSSGARYIIDMTQRSESGKELESFRGGFNGEYQQTLDRQAGILTLSKQDKTPSAFFWNIEYLFKPFSFLRDNGDPFRFYPHSLDDVRNAILRFAELIKAAPLGQSADKANRVVEVAGSKGFKYVVHCKSDKSHVPVRFVYQDDKGITRAMYEVSEIGTVSGVFKDKSFYYPKVCKIELFDQHRMMIRTDRCEVTEIDIQSKPDESVFTIPFNSANHIWDKDANVWIKVNPTITPKQ